MPAVCPLERGTSLECISTVCIQPLAWLAVLLSGCGFLYCHGSDGRAEAGEDGGCQAQQLEGPGHSYLYFISFRMSMMNKPDCIFLPYVVFLVCVDFLMVDV